MYSLRKRQQVKFIFALIGFVYFINWIYSVDPILAYLAIFIASVYVYRID